MVYQRALQRHTGLDCAADVIVRGEERDVIINSEAGMEGCHWVEVIVWACEGGRQVTISVWCDKVKVGLGKNFLDNARAIELLRDVGRFVPGRRANGPLSGGGVEVWFVAKLPVIELAILESGTS